MSAPAPRQMQREPAIIGSRSTPLAFSGLENSAASVTISPATTNKNLKFEDTLESFFKSTSQRDEFKTHLVFTARSRQCAGSVRGTSGSEEPKKARFSERIVALSETSAKTEEESVETTGGEACTEKGKSVETAGGEAGTEKEKSVETTGGEAGTEQEKSVETTGEAGTEKGKSVETSGGETGTEKEKSVETTGGGEAGTEQEKSVETTGEAGTEKRKTLFALRPAPEGLVSTIMDAYNKHCNLVISPDDVWLTILAQFCAYVNKNAEELRGRIVEHEGKKNLVVSSFGALETADYQRMIRDLLGEIRKNVKSPELADWFRPAFSTTTERDEVCAAATAMASLQRYFSFGMTLGCGIPSVTLRGTVADWKLLRKKVDRLLEFEVQNTPDGSNIMAVWVGYLRKVCDGFVESAEHPMSVKTLEFWDKVFSHRGGFSGPSYITGWVSAFTCFNIDGKYIATTTDMRGIGSEFPLVAGGLICHNVVSRPVIIDDNGKKYDGTLLSGQMVYEAERGEKDAYPTIRPRNDWCMAVVAK